MSLEGCDIIQILDSTPCRGAPTPLASPDSAGHFLASGFYLVLGPAVAGKGRRRPSAPRLVGPLPSRAAAEALRISAHALGVVQPRPQHSPAAAGRPPMPRLGYLSAPFLPPRHHPWRQSQPTAGRV